jgi:hypothetical protein
MLYRSPKFSRVRMKERERNQFFVTDAKRPVSFGPDSWQERPGYTSCHDTTLDLFFAGKISLKCVITMQARLPTPKYGGQTIPPNLLQPDQVLVKYIDLISWKQSKQRSKRWMQI